MSTSVLATVPWWRALLERLGRNAVVTASPYLAAVVTAGGVIDLQTVAVGVAGAMVISLVKAALLALLQLEATPGTTLGWQLLDRAVPAAAGVLAGLWPADASGLASIDAGAAVTAAGAAALLAVVGFWVTPPALTARTGLRPRGDGGAARLNVAVAVAALLGVVAALVMLAGDAHAASPRKSAGLVYLGVSGRQGASLCDGWLTVPWQTQTLQRGEWVPQLDDGTVDVRVQLRFFDDGAPASGQWRTVNRGRSVSDPHHDRVANHSVGVWVAETKAYDMVRVVGAGVTSAPAVIYGYGCQA